MPSPVTPPRGRAAVATLIATRGSTPKHPGAKMWVDEEGRILGSVTIGGCVDARVIEESARVIGSDAASVLEMSLGDEDAWALGMTCGGTVEVLVEPVRMTDPSDPISSALRLVQQAVDSGRRAVIVVPLDGSLSRLVVIDGEAATGSLGDAALDEVAAAVAREVSHSGSSGVYDVTAGDRSARFYFERHAPPLTLFVFGATHVAIPLVEMARTLGLRTMVVDGRGAFASRERFPNADEVIVGMPSAIAEQLDLGPTSLVVLLSHDYKYDLPVLRAVLESDASYIGVLGSARRGKALLEFLAEQGVSREKLDRVRVPIGLDIGAVSAEEIALSVLAEAITVARGRAGGAMRDRRRDAAPAP